MSALADTQMRLGLIGVGRWGRNYVRTIQRLPGVQLAMVHSRNPETAGLVPAMCRIVDDWRKVLDASDVDGIIIATPPSSHAEILIEAVRRDKPVLIEKPLVQSRGDAERVRSCLDKMRVAIVVNHVHLFHPAFRTLQKEAAALGPIRAIASAAGNLGPYRRDVPVLWDWAPHDLAMCLTLVPGLARAVRAVRLDSHAKEGATAETIAVELELAGAVTAQIRLSNLEERHRWMSVTFDEGSLVYRDSGPVMLERREPGVRSRRAAQPIAVAYEEPLACVLRDFAAAVRANDRSRASVELGLAVVDLVADIEDCLASA